jgi:hypothetical protein
MHARYSASKLGTAPSGGGADAFNPMVLAGHRWGLNIGTVEIDLESTRSRQSWLWQESILEMRPARQLA